MFRMVLSRRSDPAEVAQAVVIEIEQAESTARIQ
jgi:hypothetical protein